MRSARQSRVTVAAALAALLAACPEGAGGPADADLDAADEDAPDGEPSPAPAAAPAPPDLTPCPPGWREVEAAGPGLPSTCDPWPAGGVDDCGPGEAHLVGTPGCAPLGPACPSSPWAEDLPADREVVHVLAGSPEGGDGSAAAPFARIRDGLAAVSPGGVVALGRGVYEEAIELRGVALWGACPAETLILSTTPSDFSATVGVRGEGSELRRVTVGGPRVGIYVAAATAVRIDDVVVDGAADLAIQVEFESEVVASGLVVRDTATHPRAPSGGKGLQASTGSHVTVLGGAFERNRDLQVFAADEGTVLELEDVVVRDSLSHEGTGSGGGGVAAEAGARLVLRRVVLERTRYLAASIYDPSTTLVLEDVLIRETRAQERGEPSRGRGIDARDGVVEGVRVALLSSQEHGIHVSGGASLTLEHLVVGGTESRQSDGRFGVGVEIAVGARASLRRAAISGNRYAGLSVRGAGTDVELEDVAVLDTLAEAADASDGGAGFGLALYDHATVRIRRVLCERSTAEGVQLRDGAVVVAEDLTVRDTRSTGTGGLFGRGIGVVDGARLDATRLTLDGNRDASVVVFGAEARMSAVDLTVERTLARSCVETGCPSGGVGVAALGGGAFEATVFRIADAALAGVQVAHGMYRDEAGAWHVHDVAGAADLHEGTVELCPVGANVQAEGFDVTRLADRVRYVGNGRDLDTAELQVPDPSTGLSE